MPNPAGKIKSKGFSSTNWGQKRPSLTRELEQVNLTMIKPIFFPLHAKEEADGRVQHWFVFVFF